MVANVLEVLHLQTGALSGGLQDRLDGWQSPAREDVALNEVNPIAGRLVALLGHGDGLEHHPAPGREECVAPG